MKTVKKIILTLGVVSCMGIVLANANVVEKNSSVRGGTPAGVPPPPQGQVPPPPQGQVPPPPQGQVPPPPQGQVPPPPQGQVPPPPA